MKTIYCQSIEQVYDFQKSNKNYLVRSKSIHVCAGETCGYEFINPETYEAEYVLVVDEQEYDNAPFCEKY
jgi:hypothetical protein